MLTAKEMMAEKRAKKEKQNIKRRANQGIGNQKADRNTEANIRYRQSVFIASMTKGEPCNQDENVTDEIRNLLHYGALVYQYDITSVTVFEKLIRAMRVVAAIYGDDNLRAVCKSAEKALITLKDDDGSPNQRRVLLRPLVILSSMAAQYGEIIPARTADAVAKYCSAVQVTLYSATYYDRPIEHLQALNAVAGGESLRAVAKQYGIKEPVMRLNILDAAWHLYRIAECFQDVEEPKSIPDLRRPEWAEFSSPEKLAVKIRKAVDKWLIPFENSTGITLIDYQKFKKHCIAIETMHNT